MGSNFQPTSTFGFLMVITMFSALVADLILLPSVMLHVELVTVWDLVRIKLGRDPHEGIPLFDGLSRTQVHYILMAGALKEYRAGQVVFRKGEVSDSMYAVLSGNLDVYDEAGIADPDATVKTRQLVNQLKTGDVFGEMGMIRSQERSATVVAVEPVELLQINERMLKRLTWLYPPTAHRFFFNLMRGICDRLQLVTESLVEASVVDSQSGLYTPSFFNEMLEKELARCRQYGAPVSIGILELDRFSAVPQQHGEMAGSLVLAETGRILRETSRSSDLLCRYDGSRFAILMGYNDLRDAANFCEGLRAILADHPFEFNGNPIRITASVGVAVFQPGTHKNLRDFLDDAFAALGKAKEEGGNTVKISNDKVQRPNE
jgi:hypothetical protein